MPLPPATRPLAVPWRASVAPILLAALSACTTPQPPGELSTPSVPLPAQWQTLATTGAVDEAQLVQWWQAFHQPELEALIDQALAHNTDLRTATASLRAAQAARQAAQAGLGPAVTIGRSASITQADGADSVRSHRLAFSASWEPDLSGQQRAGVRAAEADEAAAAADLAQVRMSLAAEVALAYVQWRDAQQREQITRASLRSLEDTQAMVRWNVQAGRASSLDFQQSVMNTEQTRSNLSARVSEVAQSQHALAVLCALTPQALAERTAAEAVVPSADEAAQRLQTGVPADLLRRRPDLKAAEATVQAAWLRREQTRRAGWPGLSLSGSVGVQGNTLAALTRPGAALASLAASLNASLWDGGQRRALVDQQSAALERATAAYDAAVLGALADVEDSLAAWRSARERSAALYAAAQAAQATLTLQRVRQQAGLIDVATLLEAQRSELNALLGWQSARTDESLNLIRTWKALGGGWSPEPQPRSTP